MKRRKMYTEPLSHACFIDPAHSLFTPPRSPPFHPPFSPFSLQCPCEPVFMFYSFTRFNLPPNLPFFFLVPSLSVLLCPLTCRIRTIWLFLIFLSPPLFSCLFVYSSPSSVFFIFFSLTFLPFRFLTLLIFPLISFLTKPRPYSLTFFKPIFFLTFHIMFLNALSSSHILQFSPLKSPLPLLSSHRCLDTSYLHLSITSLYLSSFLIYQFSHLPYLFTTRFAFIIFFPQFPFYYLYVSFFSSSSV